PSQPESPTNPPKDPVPTDPSQPISPSNPPVDTTGDQPIISIEATDPVAIEGSRNSATDKDGQLVFTVRSANTIEPGMTVTAKVSVDPASIVKVEDIEKVLVDGQEVPVADFFGAGVPVTLTGDKKPVITVIAKDDNFPETSEAMTVKLTDVQNANVGTGTAQGVIYDEPALTDPTQPEGPNNPPKEPVPTDPSQPISPSNPPTNTRGDQPVINIKATDPVAIEGSTNPATDKDGQMTFTVSTVATIPAGITVTANVSADPASVVKAEDVEKVLVDGKEVSVTDFFGAGVPVSLTGDSKPVITVIAKDDNLPETSEALTVKLSNVQNADMGIDNANGVIYDEPALTDPTQPEGPNNPPKEPVPT
ncbi:hypothetical protein, partial [Moraxella sp. TY6]|uniref:hypothetical protein n=1 Tax=Moraxella sp. TY6 TaxID=3387405 RepID=UPI003AF42656